MVQVRSIGLAYSACNFNSRLYTAATLDLMFSRITSQSDHRLSDSIFKPDTSNIDSLVGLRLFAFFPKITMLIRIWRWTFILIITIIVHATFSTLSAHFAPLETHFHRRIDRRYFPSPIEEVLTAANNTSSSHTCSMALPTPALSPDTEGHFDWRTIPTYLPLHEFSQPPFDKPLQRPIAQ
jgi:hypothetical protein